MLLLLAIVVLAIVNLMIGSVEIPVADVCRILLGDNTVSDIWQNIILKSRLPQTLTAIVAGAGLAVSGLQMQTVFRNPLAGNPFAFHRRSAKKITVTEFFGDANILMSSDRTRRLTKIKTPIRLSVFSG